MWSKVQSTQPPSPYIVGGVFARIGARALTSGPVVGGLAVKEAAKISAEARASEKAKAGDLKRKKKALEALEEQRKKHADEEDWEDVKTWTQGRLKAVTGYIAKRGEQTADQNKGSEWMLQNFLSVRSSILSRFRCRQPQAWVEHPSRTGT